MESDLALDARHVIPGAELEVRVARASGPGGQGVNTTDSAVELRWAFESTAALSDVEKQRVRDNLGTRITDDGVFIVRASEHRSQHRNRAEARERLQQMVAAAIVPPTPRRPTRPSRAARVRRLEAKRRRGEVKRLRQRPDS